MATKLPAAGAADKTSFATLSDNEDWEDLSEAGKPGTPIAPGDTIGPADLTKSWLYTGGDGTASTVIDIRAQEPDPDAATRKEPEGPPTALIPMGASAAPQKPLETTAGSKTPWDIRREQWMRNICDCFRQCCAFCIKNKKEN